MAGMYSSEEILLRDYRRLNQEYKRKAERYTKDLLKLQRAENRLSGQICAFDRSVKKSEPTIDSKLCRCSFCGKSQEDVYRLIMAPNVYICDECARLCVEIIDEQEKNDAQSTGAEQSHQQK